MKIVRAEKSDMLALYNLQLLAFESEAEMVSSRDVPALQETAQEYAHDFANWNTLKLLNDSDGIIGAIRYRKCGEVTEVGRLMVHPDHRRQGFAQMLLAQVDAACPDAVKELYTCTKSWANILLYEKMGYTANKECRENSGLSFVYMHKL